MTNRADQLTTEMVREVLANPKTVRSVRILLAALWAVRVERSEPIPQLERAINRARQVLEGPQCRHRLEARSRHRLLVAATEFWTNRKVVADE